MVTLPVLMASSSVHQRRFQQLYMAQRIRGLIPNQPGEDLTSEQDQKAHAEAMKLIDDEVRTRGEQFAKETLNELASHLEESKFAAAIEETLRQGTVLVWGAVEVVLRDGVRLKTGAEPAGPRAALRTLFPEHPNADDALRHLGVWRLFQQRHVVVHRRGMVDQQYIDATNDTVACGSALAISPADFEGHITTACALGVELARRL